MIPIAPVQARHPLSVLEAIGNTKDLINDHFVCGIDVVRPSDSIKRLAEDSAKIALKTPNLETLFLHAPERAQRPKKAAFRICRRGRTLGGKKNIRSDQMERLMWKAG